MAELNFGLLNPPGSQSIGNAFVSGMDQAAVARAQENQNALAQYTLSKAKREDQVKNQLLAELRAATTPEQQQQAYINAGMGKEAAEMKGIGLKNIETQGRINLQPGALAQQQNDARIKGMTEVAGFPDAESANAAIDARFASKTIDQATADQLRQGLTQENFIPWQRNTLVRMLSPEAQLKQGVLTYKDTNLGSTIERQAFDAQGKPVGPPEVRAKTAAPRLSPGAVAQADLNAAILRGAPQPEIDALRAQRDAALTRERQGDTRNRIAGQGLNIAGARLALANRDSDPYGMLPPITAGGGPTVNNLGTTPPLAKPAPQAVTPAPKMTVADAFKNNVTGPEFVAVLPPTVKPLVESILRYDQRPPSPATKRGQQMLELVNQADPTYDSGKAQSRYVAKQVFVKGPVADSITASNTAIDHMDTLAKYGANLNNTDVRLANAAKQGIAAAFGANAPTTFDATRRIVGQEVVKAVVANGGTMREREEAADAFNRANSPAQLAGVIQSYQALLGGRLKSTALRYENDTGLKDFNTKLLPATIRAISGAADTSAAAVMSNAEALLKKYP